jgi:hypothetical protein
MSDPTDPRNSRILVSDFLAMFRPKYDDTTPIYELECKKAIEVKIDGLKKVLLAFSDSGCRLAAGKAVEVLNNILAGQDCRDRERLVNFFVSPSDEESKSWMTFFNDTSYEELLDYGPFLSSYGWEKVSHHLLASFHTRRFSEVFFDENQIDWVVRANRRVDLFNGQYLPLAIDPQTFKNVSAKPGTLVEKWTVPPSFYGSDLKDLKDLSTHLRINPATRNISLIMKKTFDHFNRHVDKLIEIFKEMEVTPEEYKFLTRVYFDGLSIVGRERFFREHPQFKFERLSDEKKDFWVQLIMGNLNEAVDIGQSNVAAGWGYLQREFAEFFIELKKRFYLDGSEIIEDPRIWIRNARGREGEFRDVIPFGMDAEAFQDLQDRANSIWNFGKPQMLR